MYGVFNHNTGLFKELRTLEGPLAGPSLVLGSFSFNAQLQTCASLRFKNFEDD
jgi:hypothetical protein